MAELIAPSGFLQIYTNQTHAGLNYKNLKEIYMPAAGFSYEENYEHPITHKKIKGSWFFDEGYEVMTPEQREPRHYCIKGKASFSFIGTSLILRLMLDSGQGKAEIFIDGKRPSEIGAYGARDELDCNLDHHAFGNGATMQYHDFVVVDGLGEGTHTCEICADNKRGVYFTLGGAKIYKYEIDPFIIHGYHARATLLHNQATIRLVNTSRYAARNIVLDISARFLNRENGKPFPQPYVIPKLGAGEQIPLLLSVDGMGYEDAAELPIDVTAEYGMKYREGYPTSEITETLLPHDKRFEYTGNWLFEELGKEHYLFAHTSTAGDYVTLRTGADRVDMMLVVDWGYPVLVLEMNGNVIARWDLHANERAVRTFSAENLGHHDKTIKMYADGGGRWSPNGWGWVQRGYTIAFSEAILHERISYLQKQECIPIRMVFDYIKPFGVRYLRSVGTGYDYEGTGVHLSDGRIPRRNEGAKEVRVMRRYPTFALNYSDRNHGNLKYYDIVIVDPGTVTRREVAAWQRMGIKVFGYVSFGEEDGVLIDPWDVRSGKRPHTDDGAGVGGYASYYSKGGNGYAELNECLHDGLIKTREKKCLLGDAHYFTGTGCCTRVCQHDTRTGYTVWESGGQCGGGHTKDDYWIRTGNEACTNAQCPHYAPYHGGCPHYQHHDGWGQDLTYTTPDYPDQNGIWGSSYINPLAPRWKEKLATFYLRRVFGLPKKVTEKVRLKKYSSELAGESYIFRSSEYPIDKNEPVHLYSAEGKEYRSLAYSFDPTTGAFQVDKNDVAAFGDADAELTVSYHVVGMGADGVFMDTLDTVDVYPSEAFQQGMARMINELKAAYPQKQFIANRGFSILKDIIASCSYVMFETFISEYNWETKQYHRITDPAAIAFNEEIKELLRKLRRDNIFEVLALNYCADDAAGDELREQIAQECYAEGYLSWSSNIQLDDVLRPYLVRSDAWKENVKQDNPFFGNVPAVDSGWVVRVQNEVEICGDYTESNRIWQRLPAVERDDWYEVLRFPVVGGYLEREVTTLAWCWRLALVDGRVLGFTSCDVDLVIDGETYESCTGFAPTAVSSSNDLATDNLDVDGMISSERITEEDIFLGVYDNAKIRIFICDYEHTENHFILREGTVGKITAGKTAFKAEIRGLMDAYQQQVGQTYQRKCRARLGDAQCQCSIVNDTVTGRVTAVRADGSIFTDVSRADDFFTYGVLTFSSGLNKGASYEVEQSLARNGQIRFFSPPLHEIVVGDTFHLVPGCNGEPDTCKKRFHNLINFRGEPYIPGNDYAVGYPLKNGGNIVPEGQSVQLRSFEFQR
jgi:uncharacterized phage protein (TIGR02218 family)